jgi:hypothetical protein
LIVAYDAGSQASGASLGSLKLDRAPATAMSLFQRQLNLRFYILTAVAATCPPASASSNSPKQLVEVEATCAAPKIKAAKVPGACTTAW